MVKRGEIVFKGVKRRGSKEGIVIQPRHPLHLKGGEMKEGRGIKRVWRGERKGTDSGASSWNLEVKSS